MDTSNTINAKAEELRLKLRAKLKVRARSFPQAVHKAGHDLPRRLRAQAAIIIQALSYGGHPKLMMRVDMAAFDQAHAEIGAYLDAIDLTEQRKDKWLAWLSTSAVQILIVAAAFIGWLRWSGHL